MVKKSSISSSSSSDLTTAISRRDCLKRILLSACALPVTPSVFASSSASTSTSNSATTTSSLTSFPVSSVSHRILTCNILLDLPEHQGQIYEWTAHRKAVCFQIIRSHNPDIFCMQEVGRGQHQDLVESFPEYESYGYPDPYVDKKPKRFQSAKNVIMFRSNRYNLISAGTYWLSNTPFKPGSRLPHDGLPRHVNWVRLADKQSGKEFRVLDTHWTLTQQVRLLEAEILVNEVSQYQPDFPQLLCGDFNSTSLSPEQKLLLDSGWKDTYTAVHPGENPPRTGHALDVATPLDQAPGSKIDFIFFRGSIKPIAASIIRDNNGTIYPSDHFFVSADVIM